MFVDFEHSRVLAELEPEREHARHRLIDELGAVRESCGEVLDGLMHEVEFASGRERRVSYGEEVWKGGASLGNRCPRPLRQRLT